MEKIKFTNLLVLCLMLFGAQAFAQTTFPGTTGPVPPVGTSGTSQFTANVTGIGVIGAGGATLDNVTIESMTHTFDGDLDISIIAPSGEIMLLAGGNGGSLNDYIGTTFDNLGNPCVESGSAPYTGNWEPEGGLAVNSEGNCLTNQNFAARFDGVDADGTWILNVLDNFGGDSGFMNGWSITLTAAAGGGGGGACELVCPVSVIVATTDPGSDCSAFVEIPQPLHTSDCDLSTLTNDYNGTTDASDTYPEGTTIVEYCIIDATTGDEVCCTVEVIVQDNTPPALTCPGDITVNLDAGECSTILDFDIQANDECNIQTFSFHQNGGLTMDPSNFTTAGTGLAGGGVVCGFTNEVVGYGRLFDLDALGVSPNADFQVTSVDFILNLSSPSVPNTINIIGFPAGTTTPSFGTQVVLGTDVVNPPVSFANQLVTLTFADPITVPAGMELFVTWEAASDVFGNGAILASEGGPFGGAPETAPSYVFGCPSLGLFPDYTDVDGFFPGYSAMIQVNGGVLDSSVPVSADPGNPFANGDALPIGEHCFLYTAEDLAGNVAECEFCVTVQEYPNNPNASLACNDHVNISLDDNCEAIVGADDILEGGPYGCYDEYEVNLFFGPGTTNPVPTSPLLTSQHIGMTLVAQVVNPESSQGQSCWGTIFVEDKIIPALECGGPYDIACTDDNLPGSSSTATTSTTGAGVATQDNNTVSDDIDVANLPPATINDVNVHISTDHTWVGDLQIELVSPAGTTVELLDNWNNAGVCGGCAGNGLEVTFDDEATATQADLGATCNNNPAAEGDFQAVGALSAFDGESANGTWTLNVSDLCGGDGGTVTATLIINSTGSIPFPVPAGVTVIGTDQPYTLIGFDPCSAATLTYSDVETAGDCQTSPYIKTITRTWTAVDASGNSTSCSEDINVLRSTVADVVFPENRDDIEGPSFSCLGGWATDAEGHPHPSASGYPTINGEPISDAAACEFVLDYEDQVLDVCGGTYKILRTWTVLAWCPTTEVATDLQIIKVVDNGGPTMVCGPDQDISTSQNDCNASAIINYPTVNDACSAVTSVDVTVSSGTLNADKTAVFGLAVGTHTVTFTATDACGNESTCSYDITVEDLVNPVAICESFHTVGLTVDEPTLVPALVFDDGSYDNCEIVEYTVRRLDSPNCPGNDATGFAAHVPFYCCDVGGANVIVELRVRDSNNNTNVCTVEVEVQDQLNPAIACPPNVILDCWESTEPDNTGTATASDNCTVSVSYVDQGGLDNCGEGTIFRVWTASDGNVPPRTATCVQRIDVVNSDPFEESDINWPNDYNTNTCNAGLEPDVTGEPTYSEDVCDLVGMTHTDLPLPITPPACMKILRTWYVYNWCEYDPNDPNSGGVWTHTQIIKVLNSEDPVITSSCDPVSFCSFDPNCQIGPATLLVTATDDCTEPADINYSYEIDANNDGTVDITGNGADASGNYPIGTHSILWKVEDGCGNIATCEYIFVIADCKKPDPNLLNGIAVDMMQDCMIEIWANDWDNPSSPSSDNCGIQEWRVQSPSQGPGQVTPPPTASASWTFSGAGDLGTNTVDVWILDVNGNWNYVSTYVLIQDNNGNCMGQTLEISGEVETEEAQMVEETTVMLEGSAPGVPDDIDVTEADGIYGFPGLASGGNYIVTPEKDINPLNGVSTFDLVKISQHVLEVEMLPSPYKIIAADINNDGNVSTIDLVQLRRLILFIDTEFQNNTSWRFVESDFVFPNPTNPFETSFPEVFSVNGLSDSEIADFIAMKIGDVNCSASPNGLVGGADDRSVGELTLGIKDEVMKEGETYTVDFTAQDFASVFGYQFTLGFDNSTVEFEGIEAGTLTNLSDLNFGMSMINEGIITTSWNNSTAVSMEDDAVLFSITFTALNNAQLSDVITVNSRYTKAEAYNNNGLLDINLTFDSGVTVAGEFELYQNQPNPFKSETNIGFNLPEAGFATLTVYDVSGKVLRVIESEFAKGYNEVTLNRSELAGTGVLYYQLDTENNSATKKMILIK